MKQFYLRSAILIALLVSGITIANSQTPYTFSNCGATGQDGPEPGDIASEYAGTSLEGMVTVVDGIQYWTVPSSGPYSIEVFGAEGGDDGGLGARMYGEFELTVGDELKIIVGQMGGTTDGLHGSGGGGSFVADTDNNPIIIAGGGGGHGKGSPGITVESDGSEFEDGQTLPTSGSPAGSEGGGGAAAAGAYGGDADTPGADSPSSTWSSGGGGFYTNGGACTTGTVPGGRAFVNGGRGGDAAASGTLSPGGFGGGGGAGDRGAGGGGYSGGGGGHSNNDGGGGGGSYNSGTSQDNESGAHSGHGMVIITQLCVPLTVTVTDEDICIGESFTVDATSETGGTIMWDGGIFDEVPYTPESTGTYTYTATSTSGTDCNIVVEITVHELPEVTANADPETVCLGQEVTLYGSGAAFYEWSPGDIEDDVPFVMDELGTFTFELEGEDWYGCFNSDEITVTVVESPEVTASASEDNICFGESITLTGSGADSYEWDGEVENGVPFVPEETGEFTYTVTGFSDGCPDESSVTVTVNELPMVSLESTTDELLGDDGSIDINVTGGTPPYSFDWDNDGTGDYDDPEDLTDVAGGSYNVTVIDDNGCGAVSSAVVNSQLSVQNDLEVVYQVYPNPTTDQLMINKTGAFSYSLTAINGQLILEGQSADSEVVNLEDLAKGHYILNLNDGQSIVHVKIQKN